MLFLFFFYSQRSYHAFLLTFLLVSSSTSIRVRNYLTTFSFLRYLSITYLGALLTLGGQNTCLDTGHLTFL